jgi:hypothetical protein
MPSPLADAFSTAALAWAALLPLVALAGTAGRPGPARLQLALGVALLSGLWLALVCGLATLGLAAAGTNGMALSLLTLLFGAIGALCHPQLRARLARPATPGGGL